MGQNRNLALKGGCSSCNRTKSLPYTNQQLEMEGQGIKKLFQKRIWTQSDKTSRKTCWTSNVLKNPGRALTNCYHK